MTLPYVAVTTKRGERGRVYAPDGTLIGRADKRSRVAAGMKGKHAPFYTATVTLPDGTTGGASLGTRHPTRASAMRAIRMFWQDNPLADMESRAVNGPAPRWTADTYEARLRLQMWQAVLRFKSERWDVCRLPYRTVKSETAATVA